MKILNLYAFHIVCKKCSSNINKEKLKNDPEFREKKKKYLKEYYNNKIKKNV